MESSETKNETAVRIAFWDITKAIAILLVVWGHSIQNLTVDTDYWLKDSLSQLIISFHMPLFMIVSGYFAFKSINRSLKGVVLKKAKQLIVPSISWYIVIAVVAMILHHDFNFNRVTDIIKTLPHSLWFLKSLFMCYFITMVGSWLFRWKRWSVLIYVMVVFAFGEWLNYASTISMLPFFLFGMLLHYYEHKVFNNTLTAFILSVTAFILLFGLWDSADYNIYIHPLIHNGGGYNALVIRTLIGTSGALAVIIAIRWISNRVPASAYHAPIYARIGTQTLGIYCIQVLLAEGLSKMFAPLISEINPFDTDIYRDLFYDYVITPGFALAVIAVCCVTIDILKKRRITRLIFLGES